jgi:hypothetical protein
MPLDPPTEPPPPGHVWVKGFRFDSEGHHEDYWTTTTEADLRMRQAAWRRAVQTMYAHWLETELRNERVLADQLTGRAPAALPARASRALPRRRRNPNTTAG